VCISVGYFVSKAISETSGLPLFLEETKILKDFNLLNTLQSATTCFVRTQCKEFDIPFIARRMI
jgi:hypothetical protein